MTEFLRSRKGRISIISAAVVLTAAIVLIILLSAGGETGYRNISVSKIFGNVIAENNGNEYEAYENMRLADGYALNTGTESYTRLSIDDDKYLKLEQESRAEFRNVGDAKKHMTAIYLAHGTLTAELVNPLKEEESFVVNTPNAVLAVRGTFFRVEVSFDDTGDAFTNVYTYGGAIDCHRIMPDGTEVEEHVTVNQGYKARIKMDEIITIYIEELIEEQGDDVDPIEVTEISNSDIVDIYNASYHGHSMFLTTRELWQEILDRDIDINEYYSVYDMGEIDEYIMTSEPEEGQTEVSTAASESFTAEAATTSTSTSASDSAATTAATAGEAADGEITGGNGEAAPGTASETTFETSAKVSAAASAATSGSANGAGAVPAVTTVTTTAAVTEETTVTVPETVPLPEVTTTVTADTVTESPSQSVTSSGTTAASVTDAVSGSVSSSTTTSSIPTTMATTTTTSEPYTSAPETEPVPEETVHVHVWGTYVSNNDATCTANGTRTAICSICGEEDTVVDPDSILAHVDVEEITWPTLASEGRRVVYCRNCERILVDEVLEKKDALYMEDGSIIISATGYKQGVYEELDGVEEIPYTGAYVISQRDSAVALDETIFLYDDVAITLDGINIPDVYVWDTNATFCGTEKENYVSTIYSNPVQDGNGVLTLRNINLNMYESSIIRGSRIRASVLNIESGIINVVNNTLSTAIYVDVLNILGGELYVDTGAHDYGINANEINVSGGILKVEDYDGYFPIQYSTINITGGRVYASANGIPCSWCCGIGLYIPNINISKGFLWADESARFNIMISGGCIAFGDDYYTGSIYNIQLTEYACTVYDTYPGNITLPDGTTYKLSPEDAAEDGKYYVWLPVQQGGEPEGVAINADNFPDATFRTYVSNNFDTDKDGYLSVDEISNATSISISGNRELTSLKGIEYFSELTDLRCYNTGITSLDVTKNTELTYLDCGNTKITLLDVNNNTALTNLYCYNTAITALDVSKNTALTSLDCMGTAITTLDVSNNTALTTLKCYSNSQLLILDVSKNTELYYLDCGETGITSLDVSNSTELWELLCYSTGITSLDVSKNTYLWSLNCHDTGITTLDVSNNTVLGELFCFDCNLPYVDISSNNRIAYFSANGNVYPIPSNVTTFDTRTDPNFAGFNPSKVSDVVNATFEDGVFTNIIGAITYTYDCGNGYSETFKLTRTGAPEGYLEISEENFPDPVFRQYVSDNFDKDNDGYLSESECEAATYIDVSGSDFSVDGGITSLEGIEYFNELNILYCNYNTGLYSLDVSNNNALTDLRCSGTGITVLDVSSNTALTTLSCDSTGITKLDVSKNTELKYLHCNNCNLAFVDISNNPSLSTFTAIGNTYPIPSNVTAFDTRTDPTFADFNPSKVSNVTNAAFEDGVFTDITGDITYIYNCGRGYFVTFTLTRTAPYSLEVPDPTVDISDSPLESLLPPDLMLPEGDAAPDTDGIVDIEDDQESSGDELDISDPSEGLANDEGETDPDTGSPADLIEDSVGNTPDSGDEPVEDVLALARGQPP